MALKRLEYYYIQLLLVSVLFIIKKNTADVLVKDISAITHCVLQ